ncbi:acyl carrier protein [Ensifer sp. PDNC004]|uniref:acyl carrier protein n=1 Tax=Ensifer sp. PDNC004 TaxID=2811423 RepID=UPI001962A713|nr:acyl carrier protein [Ensifer sp. PDNC004]QRY68721.1 acyl carrier protein [Ensifer sp. PDNC004]
MAPTRSDVSERVKAILVELLGVKASEVTDDAEIEDDLGADSLEVSQLAMLVEEEFEIYLTDDSAEKLITVGDLVDFVLASKTLK